MVIKPMCKATSLYLLTLVLSVVPLRVNAQHIYIWNNGAYNKMQVDDTMGDWSFNTRHDSINIRTHTYALGDIDSITFQKPPHGLHYVFDMEAIPEIHLSIKLEEWNNLLAAFDQNHDTDQYFACNVTFDKEGEQAIIEQAGLRLRGNTSRRRPEGNAGETHSTHHTNWHHCHYGLNLRKYVKDGFISAKYTS